MQLPSTSVRWNSALRPSRGAAIQITNYVKLSGTEGTKRCSIGRRGEQRGDESNNKLIRITPPGYIRDYCLFDAVLRPPFPMTTHCYGTRLTFSPSNVAVKEYVHACSKRERERVIPTQGNSLFQSELFKWQNFLNIECLLLCNNIT